jgi:hypothetical protein
MSPISILFWLNWLNFRAVLYFLGGKILPKFDLKSMISIPTKDFHGKNYRNSPDFRKEKKIQIVRF